MNANPTENKTETLLLTVREAAEQLRISPRSLWSITAPRGDVPCVRIGCRVVYDPADLRAFIERCKTKGGAA